MKRETLTHPKTLDLTARLGCERPTALGYLTLLWDFAASTAPRGDVGKWPNGAIARACDWRGDPDVFVKALCDAGWIDSDSEHRLLIHHWADHCERWVKAKLEKLGLRFVVLTTEGTTVRSAVATTEKAKVQNVPTAEASPPRDLPYPTQTKPNQDTPPPPEGQDPPDDSKSETESEFVQAWNACAGVIKNQGPRLTAKRRKSFLTRLSDPTWNWRPALAKFPLKLVQSDPGGWKPDVDWFLRPDSVQRILEGKYDWSKSNGKSTPHSGDGHVFNRSTNYPTSL